MQKKILFMALLIAASVLLSSCEPAANTNTANRAANTANNAAASPATTANNEADVKKVMADVAAALQSNDADVAGKFYSEDYYLITPQGELQNKTQRLADMRSGATKFDSFTYQDINVRSYGDMAVATARVDAKGKIQGRQQDVNARATLVLRKGADGWKVVSGQATPVLAGPITTPGASNAANENKALAANKPAANANANKY